MYFKRLSKCPQRQKMPIVEETTNNLESNMFIWEKAQT